MKKDFVLLTLDEIKTLTKCISCLDINGISKLSDVNIKISEEKSYNFSSNELYYGCVDKLSEIILSDDFISAMDAAKFEIFKKARKSLQENLTENLTENLLSVPDDKYPYPNKSLLKKESLITHPPHHPHPNDRFNNDTFSTNYVAYAIYWKY